MSTHNIGFYEDLTKIIFELSSNIINYAPYFFCCVHKNCLNEALRWFLQVPTIYHWVQRRMISVNHFFVFLRLLFFALLLLYVTQCTMWKLYFTFLMC